MSGLTINNPVTLAEALNSHNIKAGDTLVLLPGTYSGDWVIPGQIIGTSENPITIKPYQKGTVTIDGSLTLANNSIILDGLIFTKDWATRSYGTDPDPKPNLYVASSNNIKARNCIFHDGANCVQAYGGGLVEMYGCLIYDGGYLVGGSGYGHSIYTHNDAGSYSLFENNIWLASFNYGFHAHSSGANDIQNYDLKDNIFGKCNGKHTFGNDSGQDTHIRNIVFRNNENMNTWWWLNRWSTPIADDISMTGNWFDGTNAVEAGCCKLKMWKTITATGNTFVYPGNLVALKVPDPITSYAIDNNTYYGTGDGAFLLQNIGEADYSTLTFAQWQAVNLGLDANSTFTTSTPANRVRLIPNKYDATRAHLAVYNYSLADSVTVDVSSIYQPDEIVKVHQAQDYFNDIQTLTVSQAGTIAIDMRAEVHTMVKPIGHDANIDPLMCPKYGAFVLELS